MPPKEKTPAEKAAERQRILDAALDIMATEGYAGLTMRRLGQEIGASATKIYLYFVNKDQVYLSVIIEGYQKLQTYLQEAVSAKTRPEEQLEAFLRAYVEFARSHSAYFQAMVQKKAPSMSQYAGTPLEETARAKFESGLVVLTMARQLLDAYLKEMGCQLTLSSDMAAFFLLVFLNGLLNSYHNGLVEEVFPGQNLLAACLQLLKDICTNFALPDAAGTLAEGQLPTL